MNTKSTIKTILRAAMTLTELHKKNRPFCALSFQTAMMLLVMLLMLGAQTARAQQYARQITTIAYEHGGVTTDKTSAYEGETVTLTVTPDAGYHLALLYLDDGQSISYSGSTAIFPVQSSTDPSKYTFTCPATTELSGALYVTATFEEDASLTIRVVPEGCGTYNVVDGTKLYVTPETDYYINNVTWYSGNPDGGGTVTSVVLNDAMGYYEAPNSSGYVVVTLHKWGDYDDVRVSFNMKNHGTAPAAQSLHLGDKVKRPDDPTADGYTFLGWYTNSSCTKLFDFDTVLDNTLKYDKSNDRYTLTLYAKWAVGGSCGKSGSDVNWYVSKSAGSTKYDVLTIFGSGEMKDYMENERPWYDYRDQIKTVVVEEGVTHISNYAFYNFANVSSAITIPASVTSIGQYAFQSVSESTAAGIHISASEGSALTSIDKLAFNLANASIDLSRCNSLNNLSDIYFRAVTKDVILPSSMTSICQWAFSRYSSNPFSGDHAYVVVPEGKALSVTIDGVTEPVVLVPTDGKADILSCLYADPTNRGASRALTLAMVDNETPAPTTYAITTDGNCEVYYTDWLTPVIVTEAEEGKELSIGIKEGAQPEAGKYFTEEFTVNGTSLGFNEWSQPNRGFTMPAEDVTVAAVQADQTTLTYDFTTAGPQEMPGAAVILFNNDERVNSSYVEAGDYTAYDFDKNGTPDMKMYQDASGDHVYVEPLAGADAKGIFSFTYSGSMDPYSTIRFFFPTVTTVGGTTITTTIDGGYTVSVDDVSKTGGVIGLTDGTGVSLTYSRTLSAPSGTGDKTIDGQQAKLYTTCLPYTPTTGMGIKYYTLSGISGSTLLFDEDSSPAKETPYLVAVFSGSFDEGKTGTDVTLKKVVTASSSAGGYTLRGTLMGLTNSEATGKYILQPGGVWQKVASGNESVYVPPFRAYIEGTASGARLLGSALDGETTGIDSIRTTDSDGTERWYDLNGRRIDKPNRKGLYIHNGKVTTTNYTN